MADPLTLLLCALLAHPAFPVRDAAAAQLSRLDLLAVPALHAAAELPDLHARTIAEQLLAQARGRALLQLLTEAEPMPWICSLPSSVPGRQAIVDSYLARAQAITPPTWAPCQWTGEFRLDHAAGDWLAWRVATLLWVREKKPPADLVDEMRRRCDHWRVKGSYP